MQTVILRLLHFKLFWKKSLHLFSNRSQTTSKGGKNKKVAHEREAIAECVTDVLTTFWRPLWSITGQMYGNMESICFI